MPKFEMVQKHEAVGRAASSSERGKIVALYKFFIEQLQEGKAGRLQPSEGETRYRPSEEGSIKPPA